MVLTITKKSIRTIDNYRRNFRIISKNELHDQYQALPPINVHLHAFYEQSSQFSFDRLKLLPPIKDLLITGENDQLNETIYKMACEVTNIQNIRVLRTTEGMKDTEIFLQMINNSIFDDSRVFLKIHGKSVRDSKSAQWAKRCVEETIPSAEKCKLIIQHLDSCTKPAVAVPESTLAGIETNAKLSTKIKRTTGKNLLSLGNVIYPAGSMFWGNGGYLKHMQTITAAWDTDFLFNQARTAEIIERLLFDGLNPDQSIFTYGSQIEKNLTAKTEELANS